MGSQTGTLGGDCRDVIEGIANGDFKKATLTSTIAVGAILSSCAAASSGLAQGQLKAGVSSVASS